MGRTITTARWIPEVPTPEEVDRMVEESKVEVMSIENFNMVTVRPEKRIDWAKALIILSAILPMTVCFVLTGILIQTPLAYACFCVASLIWNAIVLMANIGKKTNRSSGK